eukprot:scaffold5693_cov141-Skeletonema_menzelii.AAC.15
MNNPYRGAGRSYNTTRFLLIFALIICIWLVAIATFLRKNPQIENEFTSEIRKEEQLIANKISKGKLRAKEWLNHQKDENSNSNDRHKWELSPFEDLALRTTGPEDTPIHVVFSTDCSPYQHWQSYQLFLSALKIRQPGRITRIASGCTAEEEVSIRQWHDEHIAILSSRFGLHLTPHFSSVKDESGNKVGDYEFFNKPYGLLHWMEHGEHMGVDPDTNQPLRHDTIIILLDPDQMLMMPITGTFQSSDTIFRGGPKDKGGFNVDTERTYKENESSFVVRHGHPLSQEFGFGHSWLEFAKVAGKESPATKVTPTEADRSYAAGPPYIATALDMHAIAQKWVEFVPLVHSLFPELMAEMYAFSIASAHLELPHQLVGSLMISDTNIDSGEGWKWIDNLPADNICDFAMNKMGDDISHLSLPSLLHFCQRYGVGDRAFFAKKKLPRDFFTCESPLIEEPAMDIGSGKYLYRKPPFLDTTVQYSAAVEKREAFVICRMTGFLNEAALFFKRKHCNGRKINVKKEISMHDLPE